MRPILLITGLELRRRLRDRSVLIQVFVAPLVLALILEAALGNFSSDIVELGVVDRDRTELSGQVVEGLVASELDVTPLDPGDPVRQLVEDWTVDAAIEIPAGFGQAVTGGGDFELRVVADPDRPVITSVAEGVAGAIVDQVAAASGGPALEVVLPGDGEDFDAIAYSAPAMAMLFLFFLTGAGARSLIAEQRDGTLPRVLAAPVSPGQVVAGKTTAVFLVAVASMGVLWLVTAVGLGASWGDPTAVAVILVLMSAAIAAIGSMVTAVSRTESQADTTTTLVTFSLVMLGGNFFSPADAPVAFETIRQFTPNGWALQSLADVQVGAGIEAIGTTVVVLVATTVVAGGLGMAGMRQRIRA